MVAYSRVRRLVAAGVAMVCVVWEKGREERGASVSRVHYKVRRTLRGGDPLL